ncbi:hypothetical protein ES707_21233 [subsurface metagenome]
MRQRTRNSRTRIKAIMPTDKASSKTMLEPMPLLMAEINLASLITEASTLSSGCVEKNVSTSSAACNASSSSRLPTGVTITKA